MHKSVRARYYYNWLYIPKGSQGGNYVVCDSEAEFLTLLDKWNRNLPHDWNYWSAGRSPEPIPLTEFDDYMRPWDGSALIYHPKNKAVA